MVTNATFERIKQIEWEIDDTQLRTHAILMRTYLSRAALWLDHFQLENVWPFFSLAERLAPDQEIPESLKTQLRSHLQKHQMLGGRTAQICRWAVEWDAVKSTVDIADLPPLYEPLLELFEAGGTFSTEHGFVNLLMGGFWIGSAKDHLPS